MSSSKILQALWDANGGNTIRAIQNAGTAENLERMKTAFELATLLVPVTSGARVAVSGVKNASKAAARVSNAASHYNVKKAYSKAEAAARVARAGGSIRAEEAAGNAAIRAAQKAVRQAENARTFARVAARAQATGEKIDKLPWSKAEYARLRTAIIAGNVWILFDDAGRPIRVMF